MKTILTFVMLSGIVCWLMFSSVYKHVLIMRQALLQQEVDLILETATQGHRGYVSAELVEQSKQRLADRGFEESGLSYVIEGTNGLSATDSARPVPRGEGIRLSISYPYEDLLLIDRLIGMSPPGPEERIGGTGLRMSEYIAPID